MKKLVQICLGCKHFRPDTVTTGLCRVNKESDRNYPRLGHQHSCDRWATCGQQYYIRQGWLKRQLAGCEGD